MSINRNRHFNYQSLQTAEVFMISKDAAKKTASTFLTAALLLLCGTAHSAAAQSAGEAASAQALNYDFFKARVEPIFLRRRAGHARCYVCHEESATAFRLEKLPAGADFWTEEQSRKNFQVVSHLVVPGNPASSRILIHPLAPEAGGDANHNGGRQFENKDDPDWKTLAEWVGGAK
jgi:hypothetical protein